MILVLWEASQLLTIDEWNYSPFQFIVSFRSQMFVLFLTELILKLLQEDLT